MFFSGLFIAPENIPGYFIWIYYLSYVQYVYTILVVNEFKDRWFEPCSFEDLATPGACPLGSCSEDPQNFTIPSESCSGVLVLDVMEMSEDDQTRNFLILTGYWIAAMILAAIILWRFLQRE